ncbi:CG9086 [Drosophila busckii]|uniref:E3 ubiquitin-protein ligase n=1 Tax=Drosophila busckii TaxID=30019 RepID=A0A0M5J152_DROBS|nr:E3 ubiquitin-protein ligase UBR1 isoform X2 [Drosophila busckii]ALC49081.1 CG9086 [Drosophila busckii]
MDRYDMDIVVVAPPPEHDTSSRIKEWRLKSQSGTLKDKDFMEFFKTESTKYFEFQNEMETVKCVFKESLAKEEIIDPIIEFMLGDKPAQALEKLQKEGNTATVCNKVFKNGEPTYSCRECGVDPTCVLCVNCFKSSAHRFHKYKMSSSGGGGCCDCGDDEAWKRDQYCELHLANRKNPLESNIITKAVLERCEICFSAILAFCVKFLEIEPNASMECLDGELDGANFCTVLYNDESHTFDQVIHTLTKIAKCRQKDAMEIVAAIDREGRAVVKCDTFKECNDLKEAIENQMIPHSGLHTARHSQSLRTSVLNINAVACQQFALQLLGWFQEFIVRHYLFRRTFAMLIQQKNEPFCIRHILEYDVKLWKTARTCWHRLLISGMLMEYQNKMVLAQEFSRRYATIVEDFIRDDHDHSFSIVSLSVQLFTVPSIAHHLIAEEGIFDKLLHTFYHVAIEEFIRNRTLHFSKDMASMAFFKRANYILYDLRYLLSFKPESFSEELRTGFLDGCKALIRVLNVMQGMEPITRQMGQHMDYEPEWECAFNLHIKLASTISQVIEWASSDAELLRKLYKMTVRALVSNSFIVGQAKLESKRCGHNMADCLIYDVSTQPVSIHLPLSRFYAGIYLHLGAHGMSYDSLLAETEALNLRLNPREIIQPVLCTQAMIAQVAAGMWRRNGYSLLHQLYFYRNVRCRVEMLDRDIVCLQTGASLMESNEFLIQMINMFNLLGWVDPSLEPGISQTQSDDEHVRQVAMADEFLELLIVIIGERWMPGVSRVTEQDRLRKEIIQLLCIKSYSHSELSRALPDGNAGNSDNIIEDVISSVAVFKKPVGVDSKGVYELKEQPHEEFNVYFYHYTKEEKSKAEELQRERRKAKKELVCCPPPMLPQLTPAFTSMANILQCDLFFMIVEQVIDSTLSGFGRRITESHLQKVLHLLGFAIQEELSDHYPFLSFYKSSQSIRLQEKLEKLARCPRLEAHRDFVLWTLQRYKQLQARQAPSTSLYGTGGGASTSAAALSGAAHSSHGDAPPLSSEQQQLREKEARSRLAAESRAKIMAQMQNAQQSFIKSNAEMFASELRATDDGGSMDWEDISSTDEFFTEGDEEEGAVGLSTGVACLGARRNFCSPTANHFKCILCFEDCSISSSGPPLVSSAFLQTSHVIYTAPSVEGPATALHVSCCGHVMHYNCWKEYYSSEETKEMRRPQRNRVPLNQPQNVEFHCPYCRTLSNTVLPVSEALPKMLPPAAAAAAAGAGAATWMPLDCFVELMRTLSVELKRSKPNDADFPNSQSILRKSDIVSDVAQLERSAQITEQPPLHANWLEVMNSFHKALRTAMQTQLLQPAANDEDMDTVSLAWITCSYTVQALEVYLYATQKPLRAELPMRHQSCMSNLVRACSLYSASLLSKEQQQQQRSSSTGPSSSSESTAKLIDTLLPSQCEQVAKLLDSLFNQKGCSVLEWDCFRMLVKLTFMMPNLLVYADKKAIIPSGSMFDFYILQSCFLANLTKALVLFNYEREHAKQLKRPATTESEERAMAMHEYVEGLPEKIKHNMVAFYQNNNFARITSLYEQGAVQQMDVSTTGGDDVAAAAAAAAAGCDEHELLVAMLMYVQREMSSFLRCACLFYRCMTDVEFPDSFPLEQHDRFELMCHYLGLESQLGVYFDMESVYATMMQSFAAHAKERWESLNLSLEKPTQRISSQLPSPPPRVIVPCQRAVPKLVKLFDDYSDLINSVSDIFCPNNEREEMKTPTMCLICGTILCGQSYCCQPELGKIQVGACTHHAHYCGAEVGIFLRIRDCQVVYLGRGKGCFVQPPYLDEYGETDQGLRRGNPLRLCKAAYDRIYLQWLGHNLHEEIARLNENANVAVTQWHHM